jgi:pyruvate,orthophosphate dikinase
MKHVYWFINDKVDGKKEMKNLLGGKGANLAEMASIGLPVPPGFTITTDVCTYFNENNRKYPEGLKEDVKKAISGIEVAMNHKFGDKDNPLLVSVRSGARVSMPGMMDTVLNLGLNDETVKGLSIATGNERFAYDSYRRFIQMYGDVVMGVPHHDFEEILNMVKNEKGITQDLELTADDLKDVIERYKKLIINKLGHIFPQDVNEQLWGSITAVFNSWNNKRAKDYRKIHDISDEWGTAVNVQSMVYGNMGDDCATGVAFTRNAANGENIFNGEFLVNAQGEDVVAGIRTPQEMNLATKGNSILPTLEEVMPEVYQELVVIRDKLENHYRDMQDIEFTIENGKLWMLQTRNGKRTGKAAIKIAVDMVKEGLISKEEALMRVEPMQLDQLLHPIIDPIEIKNHKPFAKGLAASPGAAIGKVVFFPEEAIDAKENGIDTILVRTETSPEDVAGMNACNGIFTSRGGMTSHAAVVARGMGKTCVVGCEAITVDYKTETIKIGDLTINKNEYITVDGTSGNVYLGKLKTIDPKIEDDFHDFMVWVNETRRLGVRANADTPHDAKVARDFGAQGIGLCRTEHMFFAEDRIKIMREMILSGSREEREKALAKVLPMQKEDFAGIFRVMDGYPVIIRLLDPPLHEFLPEDKELIKELADEMNLSVEEIKEKIDSLHESNPMLGHRGCRLGITYPEITKMQARAVFEAACEVEKEGINVFPEVMIPLVGIEAELSSQRIVVEEAAKEAIVKYNSSLRYMIGTMIELPRATIIADKIAKHADFFSFGTNDLTQTTFGFSRDDVGKILKVYIDDKHILKNDPFAVLDREGVGQLLRTAIEKGRMTKPELEIGICGEHGGEPSSVEFCHLINMNYVSCSPFRVPIAMLAAAQAVIKEKKGEIKSFGRLLVK